MRINELMDNNRREEWKAIARWIDTANITELAIMIEEIRCCHDNLLAWNEEHKCLDKVQTISINGGSIQLNLQ